MKKRAHTHFLVIAGFLAVIVIVTLFVAQLQPRPSMSNVSPEDIKLFSHQKNISPGRPSFSGDIIVGITRPVTILGADGFAPSNISIKAGDSITWTNQDSKLAVLTFQRGREQNQFFTSPIILPAQEWEYVFWHEGEYNYWSTTRGVEGKVIVAPCDNRFCPKKE